MYLHKILVYSSYLILAINIILFFKSYRDRSVAFKLFSYYLLIVFVVQLVSTYLKNHGIYNLFLSHYYFIGQFILLSLFFRQILTKPIQKSIISIVLITTLIFLAGYYIIYPSSYYQFNVFEIALTSVPLIVYCFFFFVQRIAGEKKEFIYLTSGFFLYILCSTLLFTTGNIEASIKKIIWYTNAILYIVYQVLIFVEWYKHFREKPVVH